MIRTNHQITHEANSHWLVHLGSKVWTSWHSSLEAQGCVTFEVVTHSVECTLLSASVYFWILPLSLAKVQKGTFENSDLNLDSPKTTYVIYKSVNTKFG